MSLGYISAPFGTRVIETTDASEPYEDWSRVRSPSRAARRLKKGHRQNIVVRRKPAAFMANGVLYVHPEIAQALKRSLQDTVDRDFKRAMGLR